MDENNSIPNKLIETMRCGKEEEISTLRPQALNDFIGQSGLKDKLTIFMTASIQRGEPLDHTLFYGPPGLGKTTLAGIIAKEMKGTLRVTTGPALERAGDLAAILSNIQPNDVLFIDEIHRMSANIEEILYPAMEDFSLDFVSGKGPMARSIRLPLKKFTLIGATTRAGMLSSPLRDRFGMLMRLEMYTPAEIARILRRSATILGVAIDADAAEEIARRSRGTPRVANRLLRRVRDFAQVEGLDVIPLSVTRKALEHMDVDELGLDIVDRTVLEAVIDKFGGGPVGLDTLAAATGEEASTIEDVVEPFLIQLGFIGRTPRGRVCTENAYRHLGRKVPPGKSTTVQVSLFDDPAEE